MSAILTEAFLREIPKTDLHCHLDGSLRIPTLIELADAAGVRLPSRTDEGLLSLVFKERYASLAEYLQGFGLTVAALQTAEALERTAYELCLDAAAENVFYLEIRFAPQLHVHEKLSFREVMKAVHKGLTRAERELNDREEVRQGRLPCFVSGIIVCALRMIRPEMSAYYGHLFRAHPASTDMEIAAHGSLELARQACAVREEDGVPVAGFDLAGREDGYPAGRHHDAYEWCHRHFLKKTVHAGEAYGAESIFQAITDLHADRIGHGYHLFDAEKIRDPSITDRQAYIGNLANFIADRRITIEVCLTSNLQTNPALQDLRDHAFRFMLAKNLSTTFCTDNRLVSRTTVTDELTKAVTHFKLTPKQLRDIVIYGFKRSFFPGSYPEKRDYCRNIIAHYEAVSARHGLTPSRGL